MAHKLLTEKFVASVKPPKDSAQVDYFDLGHPALALRVGHREKVFTLHYREQGKLRRRTLGRYPEMTLAEAREEWRRHRKAAAEGKVLVAVDVAASVAALLVSEVMPKYLEAWQRGKRPNSVKAVEGQVRKYIRPAWGPRDIRSIKQGDVLDLLDGIANRGKVTQARRVYATLGTFFKWCRKRDMIPANPMDALDKKDLGNESSRDRVLSDSELAKLLAHVRGAKDPHLAATYFMMLSGNRPEEIGGLRWDEIGADVIAIPGDRMKNKLPFDLPITSHLRAILDSVPRIDGCPYVFTRDGKNAVSGWDKVRTKINTATGLSDWQHRDLRRTMSTGMQRLGIREDVIDACQAHVKTGVKRVYQRHLYADEKRKAFEAWGLWITGNRT
jgi:integrase